MIGRRLSLTLKELAEFACLYRIGRTSETAKLKKLCGWPAA